MEKKLSDQDTAAKLIGCAAAALAVYYGLQKLLEKGALPVLEPYRPWLEKNKLQAIALIAALLFALTLLLPPGEKGKAPSSPDPCQGYEPVE